MCVLTGVQQHTPCATLRDGGAYAGHCIHLIAHKPHKRARARVHWRCKSMQSEAPTARHAPSAQTIAVRWSAMKTERDPPTPKQSAGYESAQAKTTYTREERGACYRYFAVQIDVEHNTFHHPLRSVDLSVTAATATATAATAARCAGGGFGG